MKDTGAKINGSPLYISDGPVSANGLDSLGNYYYVNTKKGEEGLFFFTKYKICNIYYHVNNGNLEFPTITLKIPKISSEIIFDIIRENTKYTSKNNGYFGAVILYDENQKNFFIKYFIYTTGGTTYESSYILPPKLLLEMKKLPSSQYPVGFVAFSNYPDKIELPKDFEGLLLSINSKNKYEINIDYINNPIRYRITRFPQEDLLAPLKEIDIIS